MEKTNQPIMKKKEPCFIKGKHRLELCINQSHLAPKRKAVKEEGEADLWHATHSGSIKQDIENIANPPKRKAVKEEGE